MTCIHERVSILRQGTHALIDLDAYARNIQTLRSLTPPGTAFMAVIKADAYGHGAAMCGHAAGSAGAEYLGVARISEGMYLRQQGVTAPIIVLGPPSEAAISAALESGITLTVGTDQSLQAVTAAAQRARTMAKIHLKIDTGMRRYGFKADEVVAVAKRASTSSAIDLEGVFTHFSSADDLNDTSTPGQIEQFERATDAIVRLGIDIRYRHMANSAATLRGQLGQSNLVRSGIATYGLSPSAEIPVDERFEPIMTIRSIVARRHAVEPGAGVSYNRMFTATDSMQAADVPVGYADGLPRNVSNSGWFLIRGERCPILGRVCMDQAVVAVPEHVREGDDVLILGAGTTGEMTFDDVARLADTNNYEVATRLTARVPRIYLRASKPVAWEQLLLNERGS